MNAQANLNVLPCPFCGSTNLLTGSWYLDDEEVDSIECVDCAAGAPASSWTRRATDPGQPPRLVEQMHKALDAELQIDRWEQDLYERQVDVWRVRPEEQWYSAPYRATWSVTALHYAILADMEVAA